MWGRRASLLLAGAFAAAALLAAGCGGDDSAPITTIQGATGKQGATALSKTAFIAQADAVCGEANAALSALDSGTAGNDPKLQATQELQITRSELQSLQSLNPPDGNRSALERFLSALQDQVDGARRQEGRRRDRAATPPRPRPRRAAPLASAQTAAQDYGFKDCANASQAAPTAPRTDHHRARRDDHGDHPPPPPPRPLP